MLQGEKIAGRAGFVRRSPMLGSASSSLRKRLHVQGELDFGLNRRGAPVRCQSTEHLRARGVNRKIVMMTGWRGNAGAELLAKFNSLAKLNKSLSPEYIYYYLLYMDFLMASADI